MKNMKICISSLSVVKVSYQLNEWETDMRNMVEQLFATKAQMSDLTDELVELTKANEELQKMAESKEEQLRLSKSNMKDLQIELNSLQPCNERQHPSTLHVNLLDWLAARTISATLYIGNSIDA